MGVTSQRQVEANRRNAMRSTGPRTEEGKRRSRQNGLRHGMAAEVVVPEEDRAAYDAAMARWEREAGPDNVVEEQLIRRAAVASVRLERIERANEEAREARARAAVDRWERRKQAAARRAGQRLPLDPTGVVAELEATPFGCDWMIRQWRALEATLRLGKGWDQRAVDRAQALLGLPPGVPGAGAEPEVRRLWILATASAPGRAGVIARLGGEADLPTDPEGARRALLRFVERQVDRLVALRDDSWEDVEGPERDAVAALAAAADTTREGRLRHRYEASADRSCFAAIRLFLNVRDRRRRELLAIAKEAAEMRDAPRAPVGGGWWREPDSDPAPPGFARLASTAPAPPPPPPQADDRPAGDRDGAAPPGPSADSVPSPPRPAAAPGPAAGPRRRAVSAASRPAAPAGRPCVAARRSEAISAAIGSGGRSRNLFFENGLGDEVLGFAVGDGTRPGRVRTCPGGAR